MSLIVSDRYELKDTLRIHDSKNGVKKTKITMIDHDTGKVLGEFQNKVLVPGSQSTACKQFGIDPVVNLPTYNSELNLENPHKYSPYPNVQPKNTPITCLWAAGRDGAGSSPNEIFTVSTTDRISPKKTTAGYTDIVPFRYVDVEDDLDDDLRKVYFGRKVIDNKVAYFFKAFDTTPQLHVRYLDGTEVTANMYNVDSSQNVEVYVEMRLAVTRKDFRDYFNEVLGWDLADISTISLLTAWYDNYTINPNADKNDQTAYRYYYDILPFSKFNFGQEQLIDLNRAIDFIYQVYY